MDIPDLGDIISFKGFSFVKYSEGERNILKPQLEALGYSDIKFYNLDADSFGPLVRGVSMKNKEGQLITSCYG